MSRGIFHLISDRGDKVLMSVDERGEICRLAMANPKASFRLQHYCTNFSHASLKQSFIYSQTYHMNQDFFETTKGDSKKVLKNGAFKAIMLKVKVLFHTVFNY